MFPTAASVIYRNADGEVLGWDTAHDDAPDVDDYYGREVEYEPADDPQHSHYEDTDFDTAGLEIPGNVLKECSWCRDPLYGPWDESYYAEEATSWR